MSVDETMRIARIVKNLKKVGVEDSHGSLERRLRVLVNIEDGNIDVVELVCLRMFAEYGHRFSIASLVPLSYDDSRRHVVLTIPEDTPDAWGWSLWVEKLVLNRDRYAQSARYWLDEWKDALENGEPARAQRARGMLFRLNATVETATMTNTVTF